MNPSAVQNAIAYIEELFSANADGHDAAHSLRVYKNALRLARSYPECDETTVSLAAILHDADDHKLFATENNANARRFLATQGLDECGIERICTIINGVSFSKNRGRRPESLEGMIVQDADRLDALGAVGIARTFAYGGKHGRSLEASLEHFYDKLLLLKDEMNTAEAARLAKERHDYLLGFIERFKEETGAEENEVRVRFYDEVPENLLKFAVIIARSGGKWVFCRHRERETFEVPGGHREEGERTADTARRELYEETGAVKFSLTPVCFYSVTMPDKFDGRETFGALFYAEIEEFESELHSEIERVFLFDELPEIKAWTYPLIQPKLIEEAQRRGIC